METLDPVQQRKNQGSRLTKILEALKLNPTEFYRALGFKRGYDSYTQIVQGKSGVSQRLVRAISDKFPEVNTDYLLYGQGKVWKNTQNIMRGVPFFGPGDNDSMLAFFDNGALPNNFSNYSSFSMFKTVEAYLSIHTDTMSPVIKSGDAIAIRRVKDVATAALGNVFYIISNEGHFLYYLRKGKGSTLNLVPENPKFEPLEITADQINQIFLVEGVISKLV